MILTYVQVPSGKRLLTVIPMRTRVPHLHQEWIKEGKALMKSPVHCPAILKGAQDLHTFLLWILEEVKNVYNEIIGKITSVHFSVISNIIHNNAVLLLCPEQLGMHCSGFLGGIVINYTKVSALV